MERRKRRTRWRRISDVTSKSRVMWMRWWVCRNRMAGNCDRMREDVKQGGAWCAACLVPWSPATLVRRRGVGLGVSLMCRWEVCVRVSNGGVGRGGQEKGISGHVWKE